MGILIIFSGDMCVGEILFGSQTCERSGAAASRSLFSNESPTKWVSFESLSKAFLDKLNGRGDPAGKRFSKHIS